MNSVECYDPKTNTWTYSKPLATARRGCGLAVFNGMLNMQKILFSTCISVISFVSARISLVSEKLYAVGGSDGSSSLDSVEIFDPDSEGWLPGPKMTMPRGNVGVAVLEDRLYAVGGFSGKYHYLSSIINSVISELR